MQYILWQKTEFAEDWTRFDANNEEELTQLILERTRKEGDLEVTVAIAYSVKVSLGKTPAEVVPVAPAYRKKAEKPAKEEPKVEADES